MINRAKHDKSHKYTKIRNESIRDSRISWKAKGLLAYILSNKGNWKIRPSELTNHATDGINSTYTTINELIKAGYISRAQATNKGQFRTVEYVVNEKPLSSLVIVTPRKPQSGKRCAVEQLYDPEISKSCSRISKKVQDTYDYAVSENHHGKQ